MGDLITKVFFVFEKSSILVVPLSVSLSRQRDFQDDVII